MAATSSTLADLPYGEGQTRTRAINEPLSSESPATTLTPAQFLATQPATVESAPRRFHGSVSIRSDMMRGDTGKILDEVVQHLNALKPSGASVQVTLEISADLPNGVPSDIVQIINENCRTLRFESFGFEEE